MKSPTRTAAHNKGNTQREFPRAKDNAKGKDRTAEISMPFHHHCAHDKPKWNTM